MRYHPMPMPVSRTIGRREELDTLERWCERGDALVVVSGPPGVGKSHLLAEVARRHDTAIQLDLQGVETARELLAAIAAAIGLPAPDDAPAPSLRERRERIVAALAARRETWLVFDDGGARLDELAELSHALAEAGAFCPILCSARRLDAVPEGTHHLALEPLELPAEQGALEANPCVALMLHRARLRGLPIEGRDDLEALAAIARVVDGLPLALELAVGQLAWRTPGQLAERMRTRQNLGDELPAVLHSTIRRSFEQLPERARRVSTRCSVLQAPWTLAEAEAVVKLPEGSGGLLDSLELLERCSLLVVSRQGEVPRCRMLSSIRRFARSQLPPDDEAPDRHARMHARRVREAWQRSLGHIWSRHIDVLVPRLADLRAARGFALERLERGGWAETLVDLTIGIAFVRWRRGETEALPEIWETTEARLGELGELDSVVRARWLLLRTDLAGWDWRAEDAEPFLDRAAALFDGAADVASNDEGRVVTGGPTEIDLGIAMRRIALCLHRRPAAALELVDEALEIARELDHRLACGHLLVNCGHALTEAHEFVSAIAALEEAAEIAASLGEELLVGRTHMYLGYVYRRMLLAERAAAAFERAAECFEAGGDLLAYAHALRLLASQAVDDGRLGASEETLAELSTLAQTYSMAWASGHCHMMLGQIRVEQERYLDATVHYERAATYFCDEERWSLVAATCLYRTLCHLIVDQPDRAAESFARGKEHFEQIRSEIGRLQYHCLELVELVRDGASPGAHELLEELRARVASAPEDPFFRDVVDLYACHLDLAIYREAIADEVPDRAREALAKVLLRVSRLHRPGPDGAPAPIERTFELRIGWRLLRDELPDSLRARLDVELRDPRAEGLLFDRGARAFRPPGRHEWVDMRRRDTPMRLLDALVDARRERPGEPLAPDELLAHTWPDEQLLPESASNRLYVTIAALRREGLRPVLLHREGGYLLDPDVALHLVEGSTRIED